MTRLFSDQERADYHPMLTCPNGHTVEPLIEWMEVRFSDVGHVGWIATNMECPFCPKWRSLKKSAP